MGVDVKYMHTNFDGHGLSGFGDKINLRSIIVENFNRLESAQTRLGWTMQVVCLNVIMTVAMILMFDTTLVTAVHARRSDKRYCKLNFN